MIPSKLSLITFFSICLIGVAISTEIHVKRNTDEEDGDIGSEMDIQLSGKRLKIIRPGRKTLRLVVLDLEDDGGSALELIDESRATATTLEPIVNETKTANVSLIEQKTETSGTMEETTTTTTDATDATTTYTTVLATTTESEALATTTELSTTATTEPTNITTAVIIEETLNNVTNARAQTTTPLAVEEFKGIPVLMNNSLRFETKPAKPRKLLKTTIEPPTTMAKGFGRKYLKNSP